MSALLSLQNEYGEFLSNEESGDNRTYSVDASAGAAADPRTSATPRDRGRVCTRCDRIVHTASSTRGGAFD